MSVSYTKEQRAHAKENGLFLCTIATGGITYQGAVSKLRMRLIEDAALHQLGVYDDHPFEHTKQINLPQDVADWLEDCKLSIVRHRASGFEDIKQHELLEIFNALRHFVLVSK